MSRSKLAGVLALVPLFAVGACSSSEPSTSPDPTSSATVASDPTVVSVASLTGKLDDAARSGVSEAVATVVSDYLDAAYLGDFPRADLSGAFGSFTAGAKARAVKDQDLLTSAALSDQITSATETAGTVALDILASRGQAAGVTARWTLTFDTEGALASTQTVRGSFDLTPVEGGWQVFGYDVEQGPTAPTGAVQ